jgi:NAD-dependent deacetylase
MKEPNRHLVDLLTAAERILVFTGAGISTGSGIADYRGPQGQWKTRDPVYYQDFMSRHEARVEYWDQKLETWPSMREAEPNAAHLAVAELEQAGKVLLVATQNIDGLHEKACTSLDRLIEIHGTNLKVECMSCHEMSEAGRHFAAFEQSNEPPICESCNGFLKPATISFGQSLRDHDLTHAFTAAREADLVLALGSSLMVQPAASIPLCAVERGTPYIIINRGITEHDELAGVTLRIDGDVVEELPPAVKAALAR